MQETVDLQPQPPEYDGTGIQPGGPPEPLIAGAAIQALGAVIQDVAHGPRVKARLTSRLLRT